MARMGGKEHLKRLVAPDFWPVFRKEYKWVVKPSPGPHPTERSLPLLIIIRDILKYARSGREARKLISEGHVKVDGRVRRDYKFPVGFMDVLEVIDTEEFFRVIPVPVKYMALIPIDREESRFKICRIENKVTVKGGHIQLNLNDGRNVLVRVSNPLKPQEDTYKTMGSLKVSIPQQQVLKYYPLKEGATAIVIGGKNVGRVGRLVSVSEGVRHYRKLVSIRDFKGNTFYTTLDKVMVIGDEEPEITLPRGAL